MEGNLWVDQKSVLKTNKEQLAEEKQQRKKDYQQRIPIEGKFGQGKNTQNVGIMDRCDLFCHEPTCSRKDRESFG